MPIKTKKSNQADQLDLFSYAPRHANLSDSIRNDGREALARAPSEAGSGVGGEGATSGSALGGGREDEGRPLRRDVRAAEAGLQSSASPRHGLGDRAGKVYPTSPGRAVDQNVRNYRITPSDKIGNGSLKQKFRQNLAAIETLYRIEAEKRDATIEEKAALVRYVGWGGIPQVFAAVPPNDWRQESEALAGLLSKDEMEAARASTLNAHYTAPEVIRAMYAGLERLGFEGGRILEPACGLGHFIGLMPEKLHRGSSITGIELDSLTARISQKLYPDADIRHSPFETAKLADGFYDVAISNVPFGDYQPYDKRFNAYKFPIHDYFFAASLERIRPGGLVFFITSKGTLDKKSAYLRKHRPSLPRST